MFKKIFTCFVLINLLIGCHNKISEKNSKNNQSKNCSLNTDYQPIIDIKARQDFFLLFDFYIRNIIAQNDRLIFQTKNHDLVFCQENQSFTIEAGTLPQLPEKEYSALLKELSNPSYETISINKQNYQYRVLLEPNPFPDFQTEPKQVIFELINPKNSLPIRQVIYDLDQVKKANTGISLGVPEIKAINNFKNNIFFAVSPQQGEGNGGIATIIKYDIENNQLTLIQPQKINNQQINDLVITEENNNLTFWLATQRSGEGNPYLPSMGLVVYQPENQDYLKSYHVRNSPLIGAIPTKLYIDNEFLWIGTGNGICQVSRAKIDDYNSWKCWEITLLADNNQENIDLFPSLLSQEKFTQLKNEGNKKIEVLWWQGVEENGNKGRYEIKYESGIDLQLKEGFSTWQKNYGDDYIESSWQSPVYWAGNDWYWRNGKFKRGFDSVPLNAFGGGFSGIKIPEQNYSYPLNSATIRGDLDLLNISELTTKIKYYSAWVESDLLTPYLTLNPSSKFDQTQTNPLIQIAK